LIEQVDYQNLMPVSGEHLFLEKVLTELLTRIMRNHAYFGDLIPTKKPAIS
jgi:hypothetical protein